MSKLDQATSSVATSQLDSEAATNERSAYSLLDAIRSDDAHASAWREFKQRLRITPVSEQGDKEFDEFMKSAQSNMFWISDLRISGDGKRVSVGASEFDLPDVNKRSATLSPGAYAIIGKARSGKSRLASSLSSVGINHVEVGEPTPTSIDRYALSHIIFAALHDGADVVIDSVKYLITEGRNPGQFGVTAKFTEFLTAISVLAARRGIRLFVVVNPYMIPNSEMGAFIDRLESSTSGVIVPVNPDEWLIRSRDRRDAVHYFRNGDVDITDPVPGSSVRAAFRMADYEIADGFQSAADTLSLGEMPQYAFNDTSLNDDYVGIAAAAFRMNETASQEVKWTFKNVSTTTSNKQSNSEQ